MKQTLKIMAAALLLAACSEPAQIHDMQNGDIIFQVSRPDDFSEAISHSSPVADSITFNHVGIIAIENGDTTVIEATFKGVIETPLQKFLGRSAMLEGKPLVAVGRIKSSYGTDPAAAVAHARSRMGTPYDYAFAAGNDSLYCSELVQESVLDSDGNLIFDFIPMSYGSSEGEILPYWVDYFARMGLDVPDGEPGTNPAAMSRHEAVEMVMRFF